MAGRQVSMYVAAFLCRPGWFVVGILHPFLL